MLLSFCINVINCSKERNILLHSAEVFSTMRSKTQSERNFIGDADEGFVQKVPKLFLKHFAAAYYLFE